MLYDSEYSKEFWFPIIYMNGDPMDTIYLFHNSVLIKKLFTSHYKTLEWTSGIAGPTRPWNLQEKNMLF